MSAKWVRDPEIIELLARMQAFMEGDEVIVKRADDYNLPCGWDGHVCRLGPQRGNDLEVYDTVRYPHWTFSEDGTSRGVTPVAVTDDGWYLAWQNIAAWRRP